MRFWGYVESLMVRYRCAGAGVVFVKFRFQDADIREDVDRKDYNS